MNTILYYQKMFPDVRAPRKGTPDSVGVDVHAYLKTESGRPAKMMIPMRAGRAIPTGLIVTSPAMSTGGNLATYETKQHTILVCSRSGMANDRSLFVTNSPGIIDPGYRGELRVLLYNGSHETQWIEDGDRIAQLILVEVPIPTIMEAGYDLAKEVTDRGAAGFGSTGR